jgi:uncharacterized membrane protein
VTPATSRTLSIIAAAVLGFDGAALIVLGLWSGRMMLALVGLAFFVASLVVGFSWRWHRRRLVDIAAARRALGDEAREMQRSLREK